MRQLLSVVTMIVCMLLMVVPDAAAEDHNSGKFWTDKFSPQQSESFNEIISYFEGRSVANRVNVTARALTEAGITKSGYSTTPPEGISKEKYIATLVTVFTQKNKLRVNFDPPKGWGTALKQDENGYISWSEVMREGSNQGGLIKLSDLDIQRAIALSTPAEPEVEVVEQEVAEDQIAPVAPDQGVLQTTVINDTATAEPTESVEPLTVPRAMTASEMVAAASKGSSPATPALPPVVARDDVARSDAALALKTANEAKGLAAVAVSQTDTLSESFDEFREESRQADAGFEARIVELETAMDATIVDVHNNSTAIQTLTGRTKALEANRTASETALAAARGDISALNGRIIPLEESIDSIVLKDGSIVGIAAIIALIFLVWFVASRFRIRKKPAEELVVN